MVADLALAVRSLRRTPGFTLVAVVTLTLGIGLTTSMFGLVNALMLRPLPYPQPDRLVRVYRATPQNPRAGLTPADYGALVRGASNFGALAAYTGTAVTLSDPQHPAQTANVLRVSANFLDVLDVPPALGRGFRAAEETAGNHRVVMLAHELWQTRFGGAAEVIGQSVRLDGEPYEIIGVLPAWATERRTPLASGVLRPLGLTVAEQSAGRAFTLNVIGRRGAGVAAAQADAILAASGANVDRANGTGPDRAAWRSEDLLRSSLNSAGRGVVFMLLGLSCCVLLIACSNLANFLLARTVARVREFALRSALGASRRQLFQPLVVESLLLAGAGGAGALLVASWTTAWLRASSGVNNGTPLELPLDWRVLGFAVAASLATAVVFGVAPALFTTRLDAAEALKSGGRGTTAGLGHRRLRHLLIVGQFAMAMVLLAGAGFFLRGADNLLTQSHGWRADGVVQGTITLPAEVATPGGAGQAAYQRVVDSLAALPGVDGVSLSYAVPYFGLPGPRRYVVDGRALPPPGQETAARVNGVTAAYFQVTGTRVVRGRAFTTADSATSARVAIISEGLARALFPRGDAIGQRMAQAGTTPVQWAEIVGIAADVGSLDIAASPSSFQYYQPLVQEPRASVAIAVHARGGTPAGLVDPIRGALAAIDPAMPVRGVMPVLATFERTHADMRMINTLLGVFAMLGLGLAALGLYGTIARAVAQRTAEIGLRIALGASVGDVHWLILGSGVRLAAVGAGLGLAGAFGVAALLASVVPAMRTNSGLVLAACGAQLVVVALAACYLPARRAAHVDPQVALRAE